MIKLFESTANEFTTLGLGNLSDAISCSVSEERNGEYELIMEYPIDGIHYSEIQLRSIIVCKSNPFSNEQAFRIYYMSKPIHGVVTINAEHISYDLSGMVVSPFSANNASEALQGLKRNSTPACNFNFSTDKTVQANFNVKYPASLRSLLGGVEGSILDIYGTGEYEFDNYNVSFKTHRGTNRGVTIRYGKNLTDLTQEENCSKVYTAVYPYWAGTQYEDEVSTDILVTLPEKVINVEGSFNFSRILPLDTGSYFSEPPTESQLRERAISYINQNGIGKPEVSLKLSFIQLEQTEEYEQFKELESVYLCDTVTVIFTELGVESTAKCIRTEYDVLTDKYISLEFGDSRANLAKTISDQSQSISNIPSTSYMDQEIKRATDMITKDGLGGYVMLHRSSGQSEPDELLILDENSGGDITRSQNVWRWNRAGLGFSSNGYGGPYEKLAITKDGRILADEISANGIKAGTINAVITIIGATFTNQNETFSIDADGNFEGLGNLHLIGSNNAELNWGINWGDALSVIAMDNSDTGINVQNGKSTWPSENIVIMHYNKLWRIRKTSSSTRYDDYAQWGSSSSSDVRKKENIKDISEKDIEKFYNNIRPVSFNYIGKFDTNYGYIAQEMMPIIEDSNFEMDQFVTEDEDGFYELTYPNIARLDSMAIHYLYKKIENLQSQIDKLREEIK